MAAPSRTSQTIASRLVAAKVASRESGIPYGSLRDLAHRGELPVVRVGRAWFFDRDDIDRWIETNKASAEVA